MLPPSRTSGPSLVLAAALGLLATSTASASGNPDRAPSGRSSARATSSSGGSSSRTSRSQAAPETPSTGPQEIAVWGEIGFYGSSSTDAGATKSQFAAPIRFGFDARFFGHLDLRLRLGISGYQFESETVAPTWTSKFGNLSFGGYYVDTVRFDSFALGYGVGGMVALPTAQLAAAEGTLDYQLAQASLEVAGAMDGAENAWEWAPETFSLAPGGFVRLSRGKLFASGSADLAWLVATGSAGKNVGLFQFRLEAGVAPIEVLRIGLGYTGVAAYYGGLPLQSGDARYQGALRAFVRGVAGPITLGSELTFDLDSPFGPAFQSGGIWSVGFRVGYHHP
ncbi:MAG: hypothetical protein U0230_18700 [Polyangiales bacterium]